METTGDAAVLEPVTGAYPRGLLASRLADEITRAGRTGRACSAFLFDVDFFKTVNDTYGHLRGDTVLRQIAERVGSLARDRDQLFRYGGDEFVLLLPDTARTDAVRLALSVTEAIRGYEFPGEPPLRVSISLGVATYPADGADPAELLGCADRRNYLAKARGRGCAVADDADTGPVGTGSAGLWDRAAPLAGVHEFLTGLTVVGRGAFAVAGPAGAGHTRFLAEVAAIARPRGFDVLLAGEPPDPLPPAERDVLVLADVDAVPAARGLVAGLVSGGHRGRLGVVYARTGEPVDTGLPALGAADLPPWSAGSVRIWLRNALPGEPSETLVNWVTGQSAGLPGRVASEVANLRERGGLVRVGDGWTLGSAAQTRRRRLRLPATVTELVGRQAESVAVAGMLAGGRVVTLLGPGGIGKTRLALEVAATAAPTLADGAVFVALAETTEVDQVVTEIAAALEVEPVPGETLLDSVAAALADASLLLVLDNFEQVLGAAAVVARLLAAGPELRILVTSRERLSVPGERTYQVPPLPMPDPDALGGGAEGVARARIDFPAVALFEQRAQDADPDFVLAEPTLPAVAALCRRLDGLPLAIELAAARVDEWHPAELLAQLGGHLDALGHGPRNLPVRQQSLAGAIDWSVRLLDPADQQLFGRLAVFGGGCTAEAAVSVAETAGIGDPDTFARRRTELAERLMALAGKSLLVTDTDPDGTERYRMLETIRAYALGRLADDPEADQVRQRHVSHFAGYADRTAVELAGADQVAWLKRVARDYQNLRAAFSAALRSGQFEAATRICLGAWRYWTNGHYIQDGRDWFDQLLVHRGQLADGMAARALNAAAVLVAELDDNDAAESLARAALERAEPAGDRPGTAQAHVGLGMALAGLGDYPAALHHYERGLAVWRELGESRGVASALGNLASVALEICDIDAADRYAREALVIERAAGNTRNVVLALEKLVEVCLNRGDPAGARRMLRESQQLSRQLGAAFEAMSIYQLGCAALLEGDRDEALRLFLDAAARRRPMGDSQRLAMALDSAAGAVSADQAALGAELLGAADAVRDRRQLPVPPALAVQRDRTLADIAGVIGTELRDTARAAGFTAVLDELLSRAGMAGAPAG